MASRIQYNAIPSVIALSTGPFVLIIQQWLRPEFSGAGWRIFGVLGVAPNLVTGLCFPFAAIIRPSLISKHRAVIVFAASCAATLIILVMMECWRPIAGASTFDVGDIAASVAGTSGSFAIYRVWMHKHLHFRDSRTPRIGR